MKKALVLILAIFMACGMLFAQAASEQTEAWPTRDISCYIHSNQGGGTDAWVRFLTPILEEELGVKITCTNLAGAKGGQAATKVYSAAHDGYSLLGTSETSMFYGSNDVGPTADKWNFYIAAGSAGIIVTTKDSKYKTIQELVEAAKANPDTVKIGNSGVGKGWHCKAILFEQGAGVKFKHVPYSGSGPALTALLSGEVDAVSCSTGEVAEYVRGGMVIPLVITENRSEKMEGYGEVPSAVALYPDTAFGLSNLFQFLGFALPDDTPQYILDKFGAAFDKAMKDPRTIKFAEDQIATIYDLKGEDAKKLTTNMQQVCWWLAQDLGLAVVSPEKAGIPRP